MRLTMALAVGALALTTALTGCSSGDDGAATPAKTASESATSQLLPPVIVTADATTAEAKVGDTIVFNVADPVNTTISVDDPEVLKLEQGRTDGSATFNPGAKALKAGTAVVSIDAAGQPVRTVEVTVS